MHRGAGDADPSKRLQIEGLGEAEFNELLLRRLAEADHEMSSSSGKTGSQGSAEREKLQLAEKGRGELERNVREGGSHSGSRGSSRLLFSDHASGACARPPSNSASGGSASNPSSSVAAGSARARSDFEDWQERHDQGVPVAPRAKAQSKQSTETSSSAPMGSFSYAAGFGGTIRSSGDGSSGPSGHHGSPSTSGSSSINLRPCSVVNQLMSQLALQEVGPDTLQYVQRAVDDFARQQSMEVTDLLGQLQQAVARESLLSEEHGALRQWVGSQESLHGLERRQLQDQATIASLSRDKAQDEAGMLQDRLKGHEASAELHVKHLRKRFKEEQAAADKKHQEHRRLLKMTQVRSTNTMELTSERRASELLQLQDNFKSERKMHMEQLASLHNQLQMAQASVIAQKEANKLGQQAAAMRQGDGIGEEQEPSASSESSGSNVGLSVPDRQTLLTCRGMPSTLIMGDFLSEGRQPSAAPNQEEELIQAREMHRTMSSELSELRLEMLGLERGRIAQVGDLQRQLEEATAPAFKQELLRRRAGGARVPTLPAIDEDDKFSVDGDASASAYGASSNMGGTDSEDDDECALPQAPLDSEVAILQAELAEAREQADSKDLMVASEIAEHNCQVQRLMDQIVAERKGGDEAHEEANTLKRKMMGQDLSFSHHVQQLETTLAQQHKIGLSLARENTELREESGTSVLHQQNQVLHHEKIVANLQAQLVLALEAKKYAEARSEDLRLAMSSMEAAHRSAVAELRQQVLLGSSTQTPVSAAAANMEELMLMHAGLVEERNVLLNRIEGLEVSHRIKEEHQLLQYRAELTEIRQQHALDIQKQEEDFYQSLAEAQQIAQANQSATASTAATSALGNSSAKKPEEPPGQGYPLEPELPPTPLGVEEASIDSWIPSWVRCPRRRFAGALSSTQDMSGAACESPNYGQDMLWEVLNAVPNLAALLCSLKLEVLDLSRAAQVALGIIPGSKSLTSILRHPGRAAWIKKSIDAHQDIAEEGWEGMPGFLIRNLGTEEFVSGGKAAFMSPLVTVHLPEDRLRNRSAALLVFLDPPGQSSHSGDALKGRRSTPRMTAMPSNLSRSSDEGPASVHASDSVSQVLMRLYT